MASNATLTTSIIELTPASAAFVRDRVDTLGPWVLAAYLDSVMMGVVFCQVQNFFRTRSPEKTAFQRYCFYLVFVVLGLSVLKTIQEISVVWVQNVHDFANPDVARLRVSTAWWQASTPLMTGIIGVLVQVRGHWHAVSKLNLSTYIFTSRHSVILLHSPLSTVPKLDHYNSNRLLHDPRHDRNLLDAALQVFYILSNNAPLKVRWLLVSNHSPPVRVLRGHGSAIHAALQIHLVGVFLADFCITAATFVTLRKSSTGLERTTVLVNRLLRMVFESAIPPTFIATIDLILTQTLGPKLLWHLMFNFSLGKIYVISLLYTLNSINQYRRKRGAVSQEMYTSHGRIGRQRNNVELGTMGPGGQIYIQTQVSTHVSPPSARARDRDRAIQIQTLESESDPAEGDSDANFTKY
ncbi:hypothetical protein GGX14DRAFT_635560 [Mycena pura]|uniref:DUF6534 domain-containing protein n=1 Tax=Mycena pura TaxID=153505 RepID=A0AAD6VEQ5_9AGAR|nr:hypothetical protein GGX14DRAFT_635560 [Mycena pura]